MLTYRYLIVYYILNFIERMIEMLDTLNLETALFSTQQIYELQNAVINIFGKDDIKHHLIKKEKKCSQNQTVWSTAGFFSSGILDFSIKHKYYPNAISVSAKFKPAIVLHNEQSKVALSSMEDYTNALSSFDSFIGTVNSHLHSFRLPLGIYWNVSRIDYAFQYSTPYYELLLYILNKGAAMADNLGYKTSAYYSNTCRNINIYDKTVQQNLSAVDGEHLIRFEVQCKRKALEHMAEKYHWERLSIYHVWDDVIAKKTVINAVKLLIGKHDFFNLDTAEDIVRSNFNTKKADNILCFLKKTRYNKAKLKSLLSGKMEGYSPDYIRKSIRPALNKVGIAPILIPSCYHISILENPYVQLQKL